MSRAVIHGTLAGGEIFETGFWLSQAPTDADAATARAVEIAGHVVSDLLPGVTGLITADSAYTGVRLYAYPTGGPLATFVGEGPITSGPGHGTGSNPLPDQCGLVVTLNTGASGRSHRGRMYLPGNGMPLGADHQLGIDQATSVANAMATFISNMVGEGPVVVLSQLLGTSRPVDSVNVDTRVDIQRRRANRQAVTGHHTSVIV